LKGCCGLGGAVMPANLKNLLIGFPLMCRVQFFLFDECSKITSLGSETKNAEPLTTADILNFRFFTLKMSY